MGYKFDDIKQKLQNVDKEQAGQLVKEIKQAHEDGKIDANEKKHLMKSAKTMVGDMNLGGLFNK